MRIAFAFLCLVASGVAAGPAPLDRVPEARYARLARGVNLALWLQYGDRVEVTAGDRNQLRSLGFTCVRVLFAPQSFLPRWSSPERIRVNLVRLDLAVDLFASGGMAVMLDFQSDAEYLDYYRKTPAARQELVRFWQALAKRYAHISADTLFFEILNEPDNRFSQAEWDAVQEEILAAIREEAPRHTALISPVAWAGLKALTAMRPLRDGNVVYVLHYYEPLTFTHQGFPWFDKPFTLLSGVPYPSDSPELATVIARQADAGAREALERYRKEGWNAERLDRDLGVAARWARENGVKVVLNEFGVYKPFAPPESRARWLRDMRVAAEKHGIGWAVFNYSWDFPLTVTNASREIDPRIIEALGLGR